MVRTIAAGPPVIRRRDKHDGTETDVSEAFALERLSDCYRDPAGALWAATPNVPAQTPFAEYWRIEQ